MLPSHRRPVEEGEAIVDGGDVLGRGRGRPRPTQWQQQPGLELGLEQEVEVDVDKVEEVVDGGEASRRAAAPQPRT